MAAVYQTTQAIEPFFAPLSKMMILQALEFQKDLPVEKNAPLPMISPYGRLRASLFPPRQATFELLQPIIKKNAFDTEYLLQQLTEFTPKTKRTMENDRPLSAETLSHWRKVGLVRYQAKNAPDFDNGAALITMRRMVQHRERGWLPSPPRYEKQNFLNEPLWFCWRQDTLSSPVVKCAIPLDEDVPASALLWTDWKGAAWKREWLNVGNLGCCRWAGTKLQEGTNDDNTLLWGITEEDLAEKWGVPISGFYRQALSATPLTLHTLATTALLFLATERLEELKAFQLDLFSLAG